MNSNYPLDLSMDGFGTTQQNVVIPQENTIRKAEESQAHTTAPKKGPAKKKPTPSQRPSAPKKKKEPTFNPIIEFFRDTRTRMSLGILLIVLTGVWLIVSINYIHNGAIDQSLVAENSITAIADSGESIENAGGAVGAKITHILMVDGLGAGSFFIAIYLGGLALSLFGFMRCKFWAFSFKCLFTAISISIILGLFLYNAETSFHWGGNHGRYVNMWLLHVSDAVGAYAVSILLIGLLVVMYLTQLRSFYLSVSGHYKKARAAMAAAAAKGSETPTELAELPSDNVEGASPQEENSGLENSGITKTVSHTIENPSPIVGFSIDDDDNYTAETPRRQVEDMVPVQDIEPEFNITSTTLEDSEEDQSRQSLYEEEDPTGQQPYDIKDELSYYRYPAPDLLEERPMTISVDEAEQEENKNLIVKTLKDYKIPISKIQATIGPTVTLYEIVPAEGVRIAQIKKLEDDIALQLAALGIRIIAPIPGRGTIGIEVPNRDPRTVSMFSIISSKKFRDCNMTLPMALGATINNEIFIEDLAKMPHLLVAGATGQGKSVGLNCIIASLLYKKHPGELKFVLIDPKRVEFSLYSKLEHHFLAKLPDEEKPIVTEPSKALTVLQSLCTEMDNRYDLLEAAAVRGIEEYNRKFSLHKLNPEKGHRFLPYIVVVVDEFADLIMTAGKDISVHIARIAQKARAVGIHMIIATQRPSTDIITGMIKANFPGRIAFRVAQMVDSKTILDRPGANRLIGRGDMLFSHNSKLERVQCAFIDTPEVESLVDFINNQTGYPTAYPLPEPQSENGGMAPGAIDLSKRDSMFDDCARFIVQNTTASTSSLQRRFAIGYNKAGKIMDQLEAAGIVGPADGQKPRTVLVDSIMLESILRSL